MTKHRFKRGEKKSSDRSFSARSFWDSPLKTSIEKPAVDWISFSHENKTQLAGVPELQSLSHQRLRSSPPGFEKQIHTALSHTPWARREQEAIRVDVFIFRVINGKSFYIIRGKDGGVECFREEIISCSLKKTKFLHWSNKTLFAEAQLQW